MMKSNIYNKVSKTVRSTILLLLAPCSLLLAGCNDFLDELPDNRTEANTEEKIQKLLVAAYPTHDHMAFTEYASDNVDEVLNNSSYKDRFTDQCYAWQDMTESDNQDTERYWMDMYQCIETANLALEGIEAMGGATTTSLLQAQAEAYMCRAYAHFMLVNLYAMHYDPNDDTSLGVSYVTQSEKDLNPKYQRETVKENYEHIKADIEAGLYNISDSYYTVPKYHFNKNAAYAFACQFYLYYGDYEKAIECANMVLGTNPATMLRDWAVLNKMPDGVQYQQDPTALHFIDPSVNANLLLATSYSRQSLYFGGWSTGKGYTHDEYLGQNETVSPIAAVWGGSYSSLAYPPRRYTSRNYWSQWRLPMLFEYTDNLGNGYMHTVYAIFTGDEVLLNRAEAYALLGQYENARTDLQLWFRNVRNNQNYNLTLQRIVDYINGLPYAYDYTDESDNTIPYGGMQSSLKKHLNPNFTTIEEGSTQECLLQLTIAARRYEQLHVGKRWFDIKRWGIIIPRRQIAASGYPVAVTDWLTLDDPRRAIQIPESVTTAGYDPNPRTDDEGGSGEAETCDR